MTDTDRILGEFIDAWKRGERPDVGAHLERAAPQQRDELAALIASWIEIAPTPAFDEPTRAAIAAEPALRRALEAAALARRPLAEQLPTLRERAGLGLRELAGSLAAAFGLAETKRTEAYLAQLERGELDESRLSRRLLDALARILRAQPGPPLPSAPMPAPSQAFFRADEDADRWVGEDIDALSRAALAAAPPPMDELDRLFLGGPDA